MKTTETILINWNDPKSIKKAERKKSMLENSGYNLVNQSSFLNKATLTYKDPTAAIF